MVLCSSHNEVMELPATGQVDVNSLSRSQMGIKLLCLQEILEPQTCGEREISLETIVTYTSASAPLGHRTLAWPDFWCDPCCHIQLLRHRVGVLRLQESGICQGKPSCKATGNNNWCGPLPWECLARHRLQTLAPLSKVSSEALEGRPLPTGHTLHSSPAGTRLAAKDKN